MLLLSFVIMLGFQNCAKIGSLKLENFETETPQTEAVDLVAGNQPRTEEIPPNSGGIIDEDNDYVTVGVSLQASAETNRENRTFNGRVFDLNNGNSIRISSGHIVLKYLDGSTSDLELEVVDSRDGRFLFQAAFSGLHSCEAHFKR